MDVSGMTLEGFFLADYERMRKRVQELEKMLGERVPDEYGCSTCTRPSARSRSA